MTMLQARNSDKLIFSLEGISIEVCSATTNSCLRDLENDFQYFLEAPSQSAKKSHTASIQLEIILRAAPLDLLPDRAAKEVHSEYIIYESPKESKRWIDYHGDALLCVIDGKNTSHGTLWCKSEHLCHELSYLFLLSKIGIFLDKKGLHRVHAFGLHRGQQGALVLIPSGGGKSSLALELLQKKDISLLSDDSPLVDRAGSLHPFPMRIAFRHQTELPKDLEKHAGHMERRKYGTKKLIAIGNLPHPPQKISSPIEPKLILVAERHGSRLKPKIRRITKQKALQFLLRDMVVGLGLPQLAELVLTKGIWTLPKLLPTAASRALAATRLVAKSDCFALELSTNKKENAELLYKKLCSYKLSSEPRINHK